MLGPSYAASVTPVVARHVAHWLILTRNPSRRCPPLPRRPPAPSTLQPHPSLGDRSRARQSPHRLAASPHHRPSLVCHHPPTTSNPTDAAPPRQLETLTSPLLPPLIHRPARRWHPSRHLTPPAPSPTSTTTSLRRRAPPPPLPASPLGRPTAGAGRTGAPGLARSRPRATCCGR
jgi:hypothetical protein